MMTDSFTNAAPWGLLILLALLLLVAVTTDLRQRIIPNKLNLAIALLAPLHWWAVGLPLWPGVAVQVGLALIVFALFALAFQLGGMGGGDVKLATALALWFGPLEMVRLVIVMSLAGGVITVLAWAWHRHRHAKGRVKVPYGVAIAIGGWAILAQRYLNQFG